MRGLIFQEQDPPG